MTNTQLLNYINGAWGRSAAERHLDILNPATAEVIATMPLSSAADVDAATRAAAAAFSEWRRTPAGERVQYLFKLKTLLEENLDDVARTLTNECGKTYLEASGELRRGIENVEVACGIPTLMQGAYSEDISRGIDEILIRQPVGVVAAITPFNFPGMIPLWFLPYALACGNTFILKPSDKTPMTAQKIFALIEQAGLPRGVVNLNRTRGDWHSDAPADRSRVVTSLEHSARKCCAETYDSGDSLGGASPHAGRITPCPVWVLVGLTWVAPVCCRADAE